MAEPTHISAVMPAAMAEIIARWAGRREEWTRLGVQLDGAKLAAEVLADLTAIQSATDEELLSTAEAAETSDYHPDSLLRLMHAGQLKNYGTARRPKFRRAELPRRARPKASRGATMPATATDSDSIARDALAGRLRRA